MKKTFRFLLLCFSLTAKSQLMEMNYFYAADWKLTKIEAAFYLVDIYSLNDTSWQRNDYILNCRDCNMEPN